MDIAKNVTGITPEIIQFCTINTCLRDYMLSCYGFSKNESSPTGCKCCTVCTRSCSCQTCTSPCHEQEQEWPRNHRNMSFQDSQS